MNKTYQELCDENQMLRTGIQQLTTALGNNEWADLLTTDGDLGALESEILGLLEEGQAKDGEISTASQAVETARQAGQRLESQLQESQAMLEEALALGEEASSRCRELEESRPTEIADAVMRARREWAAQADPDYLRERDSRKAAEAIGKWAEKIWQIIQFADKKHTEDPSFPPVNFEMISELVTDMRDDAEKVAGGDA